MPQEKRVRGPSLPVDKDYLRVIAANMRLYTKFNRLLLDAIIHKDPDAADEITRLKLEAQYVNASGEKKPADPSQATFSEVALALVDSDMWNAAKSLIHGSYDLISNKTSTEAMPGLEQQGREDTSDGPS